MTAYRQRGHGYQSKAGPVSGPGLETLTVFQPQVEIVVLQGDRIRHELWAPVDIVTSHLPAPSIASGASRRDQLRVASEQILRFAVDGFLPSKSRDRVVQPRGRPRGRALSLVDHRPRRQDFPCRRQHGRRGRREPAVRLVRPLLSPGRSQRTNRENLLERQRRRHAVAFADDRRQRIVRIHAPRGELGNTWNIVPIASGAVELESLPTHRVRHAFVGRLAQWLPWNGALKAYYRFYADDWGIIAHTVEGQLHQRFAPWLYVTGTYRAHRQEGADFFTRLAPDGALLRTADSDLDGLVSQSVGLAAHWSIRSGRCATPISRSGTSGTFAPTISTSASTPSRVVSAFDHRLAAEPRLGYEREVRPDDPKRGRPIDAPAVAPLILAGMAACGNAVAAPPSRPLPIVEVTTLESRSADLRTFINGAQR